MITLKLSPVPTDIQSESIRQLIGFYRGIASFSGTGVILIQPKEEFNLEGLLRTLNSIQYEVKNLTNLEG